MNVITKYTAQLGKLVMDALPDDPFLPVIEQFNEFPQTWLHYLNYFIPVGPFLKIAAVWLTAIAGYYAVAALARWAKLIA